MAADLDRFPRSGRPSWASPNAPAARVGFASRSGGVDPDRPAARRSSPTPISTSCSPPAGTATAPTEPELRHYQQRGAHHPPGAVPPRRARRAAGERDDACCGRASTERMRDATAGAAPDVRRLPGPVDRHPQPRRRSPARRAGSTHFAAHLAADRPAPGQPRATGPSPTHRDLPDRDRRGGQLAHRRTAVGRRAARSGARGRTACSTTSPSGAGPRHRNRRLVFRSDIPKTAPAAAALPDPGPRPPAHQRAAGLAGPAGRRRAAAATRHRAAHR